MATAVDEYLALRAQLDVPRRTVWSGEALLERLHPHHPLPDPEWPAPDASRPGVSKRISDMLWKLSPSARVVCAVTAVEMVLPIWESWAQARTDVQLAAPRQALAEIYRSRSTEFSWNERLYDALVEACQQASESMALAAAAAARSASNAYRAANSKLFSFRGKSAFAADALAAAAVDDACTSYDEFHAQQSGRTEDLIALRNAWFARWWDHCRCRLAFHGVTHVVLQ